MQQAKNYRISTQWIQLQDVMLDDYEADENYIIHVNTTDIDNALCISYRDTDPPTPRDRGAEYCQYQETTVGYNNGYYTYLRALRRPIDIEIRVSSRI